MSGAKVAHSYESAGEAVDVSKDMIRRAVDKGDLIPRYIGRLPRISHTDLIEWFESLPEDPQ